jgi:uncharacterized protein YndB with AHSA1/START domain
MNLEVKCDIRIEKPAAEVFEAIVDPDKMSNYFISSGSGRMETGRTLTWTWAEVGASATVEVEQVEADRRIVFVWGAAGEETRVQIDLSQESDGARAVMVREGSWDSDEAGIASLASQTEGWARFLSNLKAYLEHGINLFTGSVTRKHKELIAQGSGASDGR